MYGALNGAIRCLGRLKLTVTEGYRHVFSLVSVMQEQCLVDVYVEGKNKQPVRLAAQLRGRGLRQPVGAMC